MKRNNIDGKDIVNVLRTVNDIINLNQTIIKSENRNRKIGTN